MWKINSIRGKKRPIFKKVLLKQTTTTQMAMPEYIVTSNDKSILRQGIADYCCCLLWHKPDARRIIPFFTSCDLTYMESFTLMKPETFNSL